MEQRISHPTAVTAHTNVDRTATAATRAEQESHRMQMIVGVGAIFLGWTIVATWIFLFVTCFTTTRSLINAWM